MRCQRRVRTFLLGYVFGYTICTDNRAVHNGWYECDLDRDRMTIAVEERVFEGYGRAAQRLRQRALVHMWRCGPLAECLTHNLLGCEPGQMLARRIRCTIAAIEV